jgi:hypothetical protein
MDHERDVFGVVERRIQTGKYLLCIYKINLVVSQI